MILEGKTVVITGAAAGIGAATAKRFSREGANLTLVDIDESALGKVEAECQKNGAKVLSVGKDASDLSVMDEFVGQTVANFSGLDILVNTAIYRVFKPFLEVEPEEFRRSLEVNITGYFFLSQKVIPYMLEAGAGTIINIASTFGFVGSPNLSPYCISKGAVANMTRTLALELADKGIRVNGVAPGPIDTEGLRHIFHSDPKVLEMRLADVPIGRLGRPEEMAEVCLFLASDAASYINGHNLVADGGFLTH